MKFLKALLTLTRRHTGYYLEGSKILLITALSLFALFVSIYILWASPWTGFRFIYVFIPHLYLIPIILLSLWYPNSGLRVVGIILFSLLIFGIFSWLYGYGFNIVFVLLYTGLDLATIMVLLLYVKDRRLVEAVLSDLIERSRDRSEESAPPDFGGDFDAIVVALTDEDEHVREEAVNALSVLDDKRGLLLLINALKDDSSAVRRSAARALGYCSSPKSVRALMQALPDGDRYVRERVSEALGRLGDPAIPALLTGLEDPDWRVRLGSAVAVRISTGTIPSLDPIIRLFHDESEYVRREAVKSVGRLGDGRVVPYLIEATGDPDSGVRLRAVHAVKKLGSPEDIALVRGKCMHDPDPAVRMMAAED